MNAKIGDVCLVAVDRSYQDLRRGYVERRVFVAGLVRAVARNGRVLRYQQGFRVQHGLRAVGLRDEIHLLPVSKLDAVPAKIALGYAPDFASVQAARDFFEPFLEGAKAEPWPNGLGCSVGPHNVVQRTDGRWDVATSLDGEPYRMLRADAGEDKVQAVRRCLTHGAPIE